MSGSMHAKDLPWAMVLIAQGTFLLQHGQTQNRQTYTHN